MDWEDAYQRNDTPWDKGEPSPGLVDMIQSRPLRGRILVPGCGSGHDVRALAAVPGVFPVGLDISPSAVQRAHSFPKVGREDYVAGDLFALPETLMGAFDAVWEHTCFCAIPRARRADYVRGVHSALRPGGEFYAIYYLDPGMEDPEVGPPFDVSIAELNARFLESGAFELLEEWPPARAYPGREGREWMRHMRACGGWGTEGEGGQAGA
jgi:SAM-dependent methyltransferase